MTESPAGRPNDAHELTATRRGLIKAFGKMVEHEGRLEDLPLRPENFRPMLGTYSQVAAEAVRRNAAQTRSGFLDYLYAPEPIGKPQETEAERLAIDEKLKALEFTAESKGM